MRSVRTHLLLLCALLWAAPTASSAQQTGTVELGLLAQRTAFDERTTLAFGTAPGVAGFLGVYVLPNLVLEAASSFTWTETAADPGGDARWRPTRLRVVYNVPATNTFYPLVGVGLVHNRYTDAIDDSDSGVGALVGFKTYLQEQVAFRTDLSVDLVGGPFNEGTSVGGSPVTRHVNWSFTAGLSVDLGRGRSRDTDGDSVRDRDDQCLETPLGVAVDPLGCRIDSDADRVFDEDDFCPGTPSGVEVDSAGCRLDGDGDRVFDEYDACPSTPEGVRVDAVGCRVDGDRDGVFDEDDRCPGTRTAVEVDTVGCEILFEEETTTVVLEGVTFETGSSELAAEATVVLDRVAASLVANPDVRVRVAGHTDSVGSRASNLALSESRAAAVSEYLASRGVAEDRLESRGFGPDRPIATNATPEGRRANRRVELERIN